MTSNRNRTVPVAGASSIAALALMPLCTALLISTAQTASAQPTPPSAGQLLQEARPPLGTPPPAVPVQEIRPPATVAPGVGKGVSFRLEALRFAGNTVYSAEQLAAMGSDRIGTQVTLADLEAIAQRIAQRYREQGYFLAQAIVPAQEIVGGVVEISVIEGKLGKLRLELAEKVPIAAPRLRKYLSGLRAGEPLTEQALERAMLLLTDLPGITVQSTLEEGEEPGTVDLLVEVGEGRRRAAQVDVDNFGLRSSGEFRLGGSVRFASPMGLGDNIDLRAQVTSASRTLYGRASYELPVGARGTRFGIGLSRLNYELGDAFAALGAVGEATVLDASLQHPLRRTRSSTLIGTVSLQNKWVEDRFDAVDYRVPRKILNLVGGLNLERRDQLWGGGYINASANLTLGHVDIDSALAHQIDQSTLGRDTQGGFVKLGVAASRLQAIAPRWNLFTGVVGQLANRNLDVAERIAIGGPRAVRAFSSGALVGDQGAVATAEMRYAVNPEVTLSGFYDAGWARVNRFAIAGTDNSESLRGYGFGIFWGRARSFSIQASVAWRDGAGIPTEANSRSPRVYLQAVGYF